MWWNSLPKEVVGSEAQQSTLTRCAVHLRLEYCLLRMFVGRPFLLKNRTPQFNKDSPTDSASTNASNPAPTSSAGQEQLPDLIRDCIQAAREALELCQQLRDSGPGLARASYIEYSSCRASLLVLIAYSIQNFSEQFRKALCDGLEMIREMSAAGESARSEVSLIESLERALARLHAGTQHSRASNETSQFGVSVSGYDAFRHWGVNLRGSSAIGSSVQAIGHPEAHLEISSLPIWRPPAFDRHTRNRMVDFDCNASLVACSGSFNAEPLNAFDPVIQMPLFGAEDGSLLGEWPTYTEAQMLEQFITVPDYEVAEETTIGTR